MSRRGLVQVEPAPSLKEERSHLSSADADRPEAKFRRKRPFFRLALFSLFVLPLVGAFLQKRQSKRNEGDDWARNRNAAGDVSWARGTGVGATTPARESPVREVSAPSREFVQESPNKEIPTGEVRTGEIPTLDIGPNVPLDSHGVASRAGDVMVDADTEDDETRTLLPGD